MKKKTSRLWTLILILIIGFVAFRGCFTSEIPEDAIPDTMTEMPEEVTSFVTIKNKQYGFQRPGIKKIQEELEMWEFDREMDQVFVEHPSMMPTARTQMVIMNDQGMESFERSSEILPLIRFPYTHFLGDKENFTVHGIGDNGEVYITYQGRQIALEAGESYNTFEVKGWRLIRTTIANEGLYNKSQFELKENRERFERGRYEPQEVDVHQMPSRPLSPSGPRYEGDGESDGDREGSLMHDEDEYIETEDEHEVIIEQHEE